MDPDSPQDVQHPANPFEMNLGLRDEHPRSIHAVDVGCCPYDMNFSKQQANGSAHLDPENVIYERSNNSNHENGSADYDVDEDEDDLGPETDVDAVDETSEMVVPCENVSRKLFPEKHDSESDKVQSEENKFHTDSPPSPDPEIKSRQHELLPEADNVADSEDSEDEWNYYRVEPDKDKDSTVLVNEPSSESKEQEVINPKSLVEDSESEPFKEESNYNSKSETEQRTSSPGLTDAECTAETRNPDEDFTFRKQPANEPELEVMDFHLNPDAKEFIPPSMYSQRLNVADYPISGSPLKQTPAVMDDITIPSETEFDEEISHRPSDLEDEGSPLSKPLDPDCKVNFDDSEISSTKAEFGDESTTSFLTTSEFQRTEIPEVDCSFTDSNRDDYDISKDPMAISFTPEDFEAAFDKGVDLNAVHDLSDVDFSDNVNGIADEGEGEQIAQENGPRSPFVLESATDTLERESQNPFDMEILKESLKEENFESVKPSELETENAESDACLLNSNAVPFTEDLQEQKVSESENSQLLGDLSPEQNEFSPVPQDPAFASSFDPVSQFDFQEPLQPETTELPEIESEEILEQKEILEEKENFEQKVPFENKENVFEDKECFSENKENLLETEDILKKEEIIDKSVEIQDFESEIQTNDIEFDPEIQEKSQTQFELSLEADHLEEQVPNLTQSSDEADKSIPIETEIKKIDANELFEQKTNYAPLLNLSESLQEFTGLERQVNEAKELENIFEYVQVTETTVPKENIDVEQKDVVENVVNDNDLAREETQKVEEPLSEVPVVATAVSGAAVVAVTTAAAKAAKKPATTASKTSTTKTSTAPKPTKSMPTSPTKTSTPVKTTTATAKKPSTGTLSRPKQLDTKPATGTTNKIPAFKASPAPKTTTAAKVTPRLSAPKPKTPVSSPKPASAVADKKPTTNGEVKSLASKTTASKPPAKSTSVTATRTTLVKSSSTTRTSSSTTAVAPGKPRLGSTSTATKTAPKTSTATTNRPKTAPATTGSTLGATKPRVPAAKSPMIDKQIKETANKQISSSRVSSGSTAKTSRPSTAALTTSTTVKRTSTLKTSTTASSSISQTKKPAPISKNYKPSVAKSTTKTTATTTTKKPVQNGDCEAQKIETVTMTTTTNIEEDVPQKDISPVAPPTDNQLIMTSE